MDCDVTVRKLETLLRKATHDSLKESDPAVINEFCAIINENDVAHYLATKVIALRIHSVRPNEAFLTLKLLDKCMRKCGTNFQAEVGKFRFLNELIKLVSPKYFANRTAPNVKQIVLQLLYTWSVEYPHESKFKIAFEMLKNQGVVKETPTLITHDDQLENENTDSIFQDKEKSKLLQKLLQSKNPEEIQMANKLIKNMVKEEERRAEEKSKHVLEVVCATEAVKILRDLLQNPSASGPEFIIMNEIHDSCKKHYAALTQAASVANAPILEDILQAIDELMRVFMSYDEFMEQSATRRSNDAAGADHLLDLSGLCLNGRDTNGECLNSQSAGAGVLEEIFSSGDTTSVEPLKPFNLLGLKSAEIEVKEEINKSVNQPGVSTLDSLGEEIMNQALPHRHQNNSKSNDVKKIPLNCMEKSSKAESLMSDVTFDLDYLITKQIHKNIPKSSNNDDVMIDITESSDQPSSVENSNEEQQNGNLERIFEKGSCCQPLENINVSLDSIEPSNVGPLNIFEEEAGIFVVLHLSKDKPREDVNVVVVATTSKCKERIENYRFQAVLPKFCKVRHLEPSSSSLPPFNPFLPPPALTQIVLISRPDNRTISMKFIITYRCGSETYTELGTVENLPLDQI